MAHETSTPADAGTTPEKEQSWTPLQRAEADVVHAFERYVSVLDTEPAPQPKKIVFTPSKTLLDIHQYEIDNVNTLKPYQQDEALMDLVRSELPSLHGLLLSRSPHWQDRVRSEVLRRVMRHEVTLPDGFPCIYEPTDSPRQADVLHPKPFVWVVSPDEAMLNELLPLYRELWAAYESQWPSPGRTFVVGRLDGIPATGVYREGTTPEQVIARTLMTHTDMYGRAPQHLREMHPQHASWIRAKEERTAQMAALMAKQNAEDADASA